MVDGGATEDGGVVPDDGGATEDGGPMADGGSTPWPDGGSTPWPDGGSTPWPDGGPIADGGPYVVDGGINYAPKAVCPDEQYVIPHSDVVLDGSDSTDRDGDALSYSWTAIQWPVNASEPTISESTSAIATASVSEASTPDKPYLFQLCVKDVHQAENCCTTTVHVVGGNLIIHLIWDTEKVDADLHLLNPHGTATMNFFDLLGSDCYYMNKSPSWGAAGTDDNPRLSEDIKGYGPEIIAINNPASGSYTVGVHYFCDTNLGSTNATLQILCGGAVSFQETRTLQQSGDFWDVAFVDFPGCSITPINNYRQVTEGCQQW